jgi:hypothetical protein
MPIDKKNYATLKDFIDNAPIIQQEKFWRKVAKVAIKFMNKKEKVWISVSGLGVAYTHLRISTTPKYYFDENEGYAIDKWISQDNDWYYVVKSYGWYPIFLFINDQWYRTLDTYSSTTRKQMSQVNPVKFDSNLNADVMSVTKGEMERLMDGRYDIERVKTDRVSNFVKVKDKVTNQSKLISGGWGDNAHRVNFMIKDVEDVDGKIKISVEVLKAGKMIDRKMIPDSNFKDNPELLDGIMKTIKQDILRTYPSYLTDSNTEIELLN